LPWRNHTLCYWIWERNNGFLLTENSKDKPSTKRGPRMRLRWLIETTENSREVLEKRLSLSPFELTKRRHTLGITRFAAREQRHPTGVRLRVHNFPAAGDQREAFRQERRNIALPQTLRPSTLPRIGFRPRGSSRSNRRTS